jgi:hypothetical protein
VWLTFIRYDTNAKVSRVSESPATSAQTKVECMALLKTWLQDKSTNETALFPGIRVISGHLADTYSTDILNETGQKVETYIVTCLPDTVDPRGPKGK